MIKYKQKKAVFVKAHRNEFNHSKFFIIVEDSKGVQYQIKFNEMGQRHNVNEFIAHYIGSCIEAPMLDGAFLKLEEGEMLRIKDRIRDQVKHLNEVDIWGIDSGVFFGIVWDKNSTSMIYDAELIDRIPEATNARDFFSLYPMDQFLKNYDRHIKNHLLTKKGPHIKYNLIDHDRIFASTSWAYIPAYIDDFYPLAKHQRYGMPYHSFLLLLLNDGNIFNAHHYAGKLAQITDDDIKDMCGTISQAYKISDAEISMIEAWVKHRRDHIVMKCFEHESILPNVKKKGIYSVS